MKQLLLLASVLFVFSSCFDSFTFNDLYPEELSEDQGYVTVTVVTETESASDGGCNYEQEYYIGVEDAVVSLEYLDEERPLPTGVNMVGYTNTSGQLLFEGLPAGRYSIEIDSRNGYDSREILVELGKLTRVRVHF